MDLEKTRVRPPDPPPPSDRSADQPPVHRPAAPSPVPAPPPDDVPQSRPWVVALVAGVTTVALIAATSNQWVVEKVQEQRGQADRGFKDFVIQTATSYGWRFQPTGGGDDFGRYVASTWAYVGVTVVLTVLLTAALTGRHAGPFRAFVTTWMAVVVGSMLASYAASATLDRDEIYGRSSGPFSDMFFGYETGGGPRLTAALLLGFVVALVAGLVVLATSRRRSGHRTAQAPTWTAA